MRDLTLSKQQYKCLYFLSRGMTYKEIAHEMELSPRTVECYVATIRKKTNLHSKSKLVAFFLDKYLGSKQEARLYA